MRTTRRVELAGLLVLAAVALMATATTATLASAGVRLPAGFEASLSAALTVLGWARWGAVLVLAFGVARARENS